MSSKERCFIHISDKSGKVSIWFRSMDTWVLKCILTVSSVFPPASPTSQWLFCETSYEIQDPKDIMCWSWKAHQVKWEMSSYSWIRPSFLMLPAVEIHLTEYSWTFSGDENLVASNTVTGAGILREQFFTLICQYLCWQHSHLGSARKQAQCRLGALAGKLQLTNMAQKENAECEN